VLGFSLYILECMFLYIDGMCICVRSQVLFRLNFLVLVLCVVMDRPYQFYYFVPLVTVWFVIIYATMALWPQVLQKKANGTTHTDTHTHAISRWMTKFG